MNRITAISLLTLGSFASCAGAMAQQQPAMKANIPFGFAVGNTWLPAGEYTISSPLRHLIEFQSADHANMATVVSAESHQESNSGSKLVFEKYGNEYFLHRVLCPTVSQMNLDVAPGKMEKAERKHSLEARNPDNGQETLVAAR